MKYDPTFLFAVQAVADRFGHEKAAMVFNNLFDVKQSSEDVEQLERREYYKSSIDKILGCSKGSLDGVAQMIRDANSAAGAPDGRGWVAWIKRACQIFGCSLKQARELYDFVRANPAIVDV